MKKRAYLIIYFLFMAASLWATEDKGYVLLNKMVSEFDALAQSGSGGAGVLNKALNGLMADANEAKAAGQVDDVFFGRFRRILVVLRLAVIDFPDDPEGILDEHILETVNRFIEDVTGQTGNVKERGVGAIARAITEEVVNLHIYLSSKNDRSRIAEKYRPIRTDKKK